MKTEVFNNSVGDSAEIIRRGGLVAVPTETVYGLAANGLDAYAVEKIYEVKGRPSVKPLSLMVRSFEDMEIYCKDVPSQAVSLAKKFWPGPLTIILRAKGFVPDIVLAGGDTLGLRCPDSALTLQLIREAGVPLAAPSANPSGSESPKSAEVVLKYFDGMIDAVIDGGACSLGKESTLIDMSSVPYRILRKGALPEKKLRESLADELTLIGITGGSGSGKTTALNCLRSFGALVIDCDELYHSMLDTDADMKIAIAERFPGTITENGAIDRKRLSHIVFADPEALLDLNRITHRFISQKIAEKLEDYAFSGGEVAALDAVELISSGLSERCDYTVAVISDRVKRIERIRARDGLTLEEAERRVDAQKSDSYYSENCSHVLVNDSSFEEFENKCRLFFGGLLNE